MTVQIFPKDACRVVVETVGEPPCQEGRDPATFPNIAYHNVNINPDRGGRARRVEALSGRILRSGLRARRWSKRGPRPARPQQCAEHLRDFVRDGAKAITLRITSWDQRGQFDRLVNEVLPRVNG